MFPYEDTGNPLAANAASDEFRLASYISSKGIKALQRGVDRDTVVILLEVQCFNTRLIGDKGKHGKNNCLPGQGGDNNVTITVPGMESRLQPTYKSLTANFVLSTKDGPSDAARML